jgi:hypothetical protein
MELRLFVSLRAEGMWPIGHTPPSSQTHLLLAVKETLRFESEVLAIFEQKATIRYLASLLPCFLQAITN